MHAHLAEADGKQRDESVVRLFEKLTPVLLAFASQHSMLVQKFAHNYNMWVFHFLHPKGGVGNIEIGAYPLDGDAFRATIASHWWIDDEDNCERSSLESPALKSFDTRVPEAITPFLEEALGRVLAATLADLVKHSPKSPRPRDANGNLVFAPFELARRLPT